MILVILRMVLIDFGRDFAVLVILNRIWLILGRILVLMILDRFLGIFVILVGFT